MQKILIPTHGILLMLYTNIKSLRLEKSSPQKEADPLENHASRSEMGFKSKENIIGEPLLLNKLPKCWNKMITFATIGHEPCYGTIILAFSSDIFFVEGFSLGI